LFDIKTYIGDFRMNIQSLNYLISFTQKMIK